MSGERTTRHVSARARGNGAGQGDGWGGPARGASNKVKATVLALVPGCDAAKRLNAAAKRELREARVEQLENILFKLAKGAERQETQVAAAARLHAIYEGTPVARQITLQVDDVAKLSDDEIRTELARLGGEAADPRKGAKTPRLSR